MAAPEGYAVTEIYEFDDNIGRLNMQGNDLSKINTMVEYIFMPGYKDYNGVELENDFMLATLELNQSAVADMERYGFDIVAHIGYYPDPHRSNEIAKISMRSGIALSPSNAVEARKHVIVPVTRQQEIFITVFCQGHTCTSSNTTVSFNLRVNTLNSLPEYKMESNYYLRMRDDGHSMAGYFETQDHQDAMLRIYKPR